MAKQTRTFRGGRMNKSIDERLLPAGEYVDAMNIRVGSTELTEIGAIENSKGNSKITSLQYNGVALSDQATCIGTFADSEQETIYWFVHDSANPQAAPPSGGVLGKVDMIVSYNTTSQQLTYHVVSETVLNFNPAYLVNGVDKIDDLLFFTDNYNEPRKINVTRDYSFPDVTQAYGLRDQIIELDISVIKPPPLESPLIEFAQIAGGENYIEDTFICFAYRYQYADGEYSALSQFTAPAFAPSSNFSLGIDNLLNDAMQNIWNEVTVTYNTGVEQVVGVDLVFKEADSNNIFVIDEYDVDNLIGQAQAVSFTNGEIYTVLRSDEILRLYDNVPLKSKAQNIFGNRLLYGNYVEQRDLTDSTGQDIDLSYTVGFKSSNTLGSIELPSTIGTRSINVDSTLSSPPNINFGKVTFDLSGINNSDLVEGAIFQLVLNCQGESFSYNGHRPPVASIADFFNLSAGFQVVLSFKLNTSYVGSGLAGVFQLWNSHFADVLGYNNYTGSNSPTDWTDGATWNDVFNASVTSVNAIDGAPFSVAPCMAVQYQGDVDVTPLEPNNVTPLNGTSEPNDTLGLGGGAQNDWGGLIVSLSGTDLTITPPAHRYRKDDVNYCSGGVSQLFQYFKINSAFGYFSTEKGLKSLHSNRDYQVGIIYQDSNARQTTVLVSENNSAHIPASRSTNLNHLEVTIPTGMRPPSWAERYKFMLKPSQGLYETVYADTMFSDIETGSVWVLLEGEQSNKVTEGLRLIVKSDSNGPLNNAAYATVLEVVNQPDNFLDRSNSITDGTIEQPAGVYMRVVPVGWSADTVNYNVFDSGSLHEEIEAKRRAHLNVNTPSMLINVCLNNGSNSAPQPVPLEISAGDRVQMRFHFNRNHANEDGDPCGGVSSLYERTYTATQDYPNFKSFWDGEAVSVSNDTDTYVEIPDSQSPSSQLYNPSLDLILLSNHYTSVFGFNNANGREPNLNQIIPRISGVNQYEFKKVNGLGYNGDDWLALVLKGGITPCVGEAQLRASAIFAQITVRGGDGELIFETIPNKVADGIYYEGADNYPIKNGNHMSGTNDDDVNQTATLDGKVNLSFFNCFAFGNGAESYKILDSLTGNYFTLGNRSAGVTTQDYEQIRREASITYSGVYQEQTALNNLNNFNLGLANYKDCEESYGPIEILHSFRDNLLVLQEDKISYIQVNKSLITSADGTSTVTAAPTILGTQIARIEEYGISNNPESFTTYGRDMFFTDAKRSSVIKLSGSVGQGDALQVISSIGMRSWFRDLFQDSFTTQKLGGFDPYMNEYILASNTTNLPLQIPTTSCRSRATGAYLPPVQWNGLNAPTQYIVNAGTGIGIMNIEFTATRAIAVSALYNGVTTTNPAGVGGETGTFTVSVSKNVASISEVLITVTPTDPNVDSITTMNPPCPTGSTVKVVTVCLTDAEDADLTTLNQYSYTATPYTSPLSSRNITFGSGNTTPIVSDFNVVAGVQGTPTIPTSTSVITMASNASSGGTFAFNLNTDKFRYVQSNIPYADTPAGIAAMLLASTTVPSIDSTQAPDLYTGTFTLTGGWDELYLIYDYRRAGSAMFCSNTSTDPADSNDVCCDCSAIIGCTPFLGTVVYVTSAAACASATVATVYYHNGIGIVPTIGDTIYSAADCASGVILGADNYIKLGDGSDEYIQVNSSGQIIAKTTC
jgi:hypothetical protein